MEKSKLSRILTTVGLVVVAVLVIGLMIFSMQPKPISEEVWDTRTAMGDTEHPKRHYIMYTDLMCPYCDVFTRATMAYPEEFANYLEENDILFEVRLSNFLYYNGVEYSEVAAEAATCATKEDKFWDFYHAAVQKLWDDYHSKGIGDTKTSPAITDMTEDWWLAIGSDLGLGTTWEKCVKNSEAEEDLYDTMLKIEKAGVTGLPYFSFNGVIYGGLPGEGFSSWEELKSFLDTGLKK